MTPGPAIIRDIYSENSLNNDSDDSYLERQCSLLNIDCMYTWRLNGDM